MRVPYSKVYRAFPELDQFSDRECEGFVRLAKSQYRLESFGTIVVGMVLGAAVLVLGMLLSFIVNGLLDRWGGGALRGVATWVATGMSLVSLIGGPVAGMLWYERWLRRTIVQRLKAVQCGSCAYSLLGLAVVDGGIVCPECGQRFDLAERGLTAADVLAAGRGGADGS